MWTGTTKYGNKREKTQQNVHNCDSSHPSRKARPRAIDTKGRDGGGLGRRTWGVEKGWWQGIANVWQDGRRTREVEALAKDWHPGGGRSTESRVETEGAKADQTEGGARTKTGGPWSRRSQATAKMAAHCRGEGGRSLGGGKANDSRGPNDGGGAGGGGAWGGDREPMNQHDREDPEGQGRADGSGDRGVGGD